MRLYCVYDMITALPYTYTTLPLSSELYYNRYAATQHTYNSCLLMYVYPPCMLHIQSLQSSKRTLTAKCLSSLTSDSITCPFSFASSASHSHILSALLKDLVTVLPSVNGWRPRSRRMEYTSTYRGNMFNWRHYTYQLRELNICREGNLSVSHLQAFDVHAPLNDLPGNGT